MGRFKGFKSLSLVVLLLSLVLFACRQAPPVPPPNVAPPTTTPDVPPVQDGQFEVGPKGGSFTLINGAVVTVKEGFFSTKTTLSFSSESSLTLPNGVREHYPIDLIDPLGTGIKLQFDANALNNLAKDKTIHIVPPITSASSSDELIPLAQVLLEANGQTLFYQEPLELNSDVSGGVVITGRQLGASSRASVTVRAFVQAPILKANALPSGFVIDDVVTGLNGGVAFDFAPDGRIFIAEKVGSIRVFQNGQLLPTRFIDISNQVNGRGDRGLLSLAVHPNFPTEPYIYALFTYEDPAEVQVNTGSGGPDGDGARTSRLVRYTANASEGFNVAVPGSELVLLGQNSTWANSGNPLARNDYSNPACSTTGGGYVQDCIPSDEQSHTIGKVMFAPDGNLLISSGDGCNFTQAQAECARALDLESLAGKLLRIDPNNGNGLTDNPYYTGNPQDNASKVYNSGLRNPFRFTIDDSTGDPFIGDVGWNTWEEVNKGVAGANFGWPCYEGGNTTNLQQGGYSSLAECQAFYSSGTTVTPSVYGYVHVGGNSIQVGDFYSGSVYPAVYQDALFITDFNERWIRYLALDASGNVASVNDFGSEVGVVQLSSGPDTNLYLMNIFEGKLKRIRFVGSGNQAPVAQISADVTQGAVPLTVNFDNTSFDPDGDSISYAWDFGDGTGSLEEDPSHTFTALGVYQVFVTVTDSNGNSDSTSLTISVGNALPVVSIDTPTPGVTYNIGDTINFSGSATDAEDGALTGSSLSWELTLFHNDHQHIDELPPTFGATGSFVVTNHGDATYFQLCLIATDSNGASATDCVDLFPNKVAYTLDTVPSGLSLSWEGVSQATPFTVETVIGSSQSLIAPAVQGSNIFDNWSDGGGRVHTITVGDQPATFIATYVPAATCAGLEQEAETAGLFGLFQVGSDPLASGGQYVHVPLGAGSNFSFSTDDRIEFCVNIDVAGTYRINTQVHAATSSRDSFFAQVDNAPEGAYLWFARRNTDYLEDYVSDANSGQDPLEVTLSTGQHIISFFYRENDTRLDKIKLEPINTNQAPQLDPLPDRVNNEVDSVSIQVNATDVDSTTLSFSATGLPTGLSITNQGRIQGVIATGSAGSYTPSITVSDGQATDTASFLWNINAPTASCGPLEQEAENADLFGSMTLGSDTAASGGQFIHGPLGSGSYYSGFNANHRADLCFTVTTAGVYRISTEVFASSASDDSFFVTVDNQPSAGYTWDTARANAFVQDFVRNRGSSAPVEINLTAGEHTLSFYQREENTRLDKVKLELVSSTEPPQDCSGLSQEAEAGQISGNMRIANDSAASGGQYVHAPAGSGFIFQGAGNDKVTYCSTVSQAGQYRIKAWVYGVDGGQDSFYVTVDGNPTGGFLWDMLRNTSYLPDFVSSRGGSDPELITLSAGDHIIAFHQREDEARLDKFELEFVGP